jgi:hypothetical protein
MARKAHHPAAKKPGNGHAHAPAPGLGARVRSLNRAARSFRQQVRTTASDFGDALDVRRRVRRHPYVMMAAALGVGYVLGGGLFSRTTVRLLGVAGRVATLPLIRGELIGLAEAMLSGSADAEDDSKHSGSDVPSPS